MLRFIEQHSDEHFDIIVIGGGITGACVAYEAATQGLKVALLEQNDFSAGTSSASSKLIHGGLRYLVNGEIGMVRESLRERRVMANIAPNLVYPMPVLITHTSQRSKWVAKVGMLIYDTLSYDKSFTWDKAKRIPMHSSASRQQVLQSEPQVHAQGLAGGSVYYDCASLCPERLTLAFIRSAVRFGAKVSNHARVTQLLVDDTGRVSGVGVRDTLSDAVHTVRARLTVNCAGPWADRIPELAGKAAGERPLSRSEGVHFITRKPLISGRSVVACSSRTGGHFFLIPWRGTTLIGTTDKAYAGDPDDYRVSAASVKELIATVNEGFGDGTLSYADVLCAYGGLRPLVESQTQETYTASRRYEICDNTEQGLNGLITVEGGKFTTSRQLASDCMKVIARKLGVRLKRSITNTQRLAGCDIADLTSFLEQAHQQYRKSFAATTIDFLSRHYGTDFEAVLQLTREDTRLAQTLDSDGEILAQVCYAIRFEMARTLGDIVLRRTGIGTLGHPGRAVLEKVAALAASELGWDEVETKRQIASTSEQLTPPVPDAVKHHFEPNNVMNPGGQPGHDSR